MGRNPQITFVYGRRHHRWAVAAPITYEQILRCSVYINLVYFVYEKLDWSIVRYRVLCETCSIQHNLTNWDPVTYIRPWISPSLVLIMASPQIGPKPLAEPVLVYCRLNRWAQIFVHLKWKIISTFVMKNERCRLYNDGILSWPQCGRSAVYPKSVSIKIIWHLKAIHLC